MQRFQPVIQKFKDAFFDGNDSDSEISIKSKTSGPRARAAPKRKPLKPVEVIHEKINIGSDEEEEAKEPPRKRRLVEKGSQKKENHP